MRRKNLTLTLLSVLFVALLTVASTFETAAQGRYANRYSKRDVSGIITRLEQSSDTFRRDFDRYLDQSSLNGTREEDRLNQIVQSYDRSLDRLRGDFDSRDSWWESRSNVEELMNDARPVNSMMVSLPFARRLERQWNQMRRDVNRLADTFDLPDLSRGGNGGWNPGGGGGSVPSWAVGRFYGRNPRTGETIALNIDRSGNVAADFGGSVANGFLNGQNLNMGDSTARVTRISNGIRTTSNMDGQVIEYFRNGGGGGGNIGGNIGGNVPNWAVGTFYGRNPNDGRTIIMTISRNGNVSIDFGSGSLIYGSLNDNFLQVENATSRVTRIRNGIRTTSTTDGQVIEYFTNRPR